jgi:ATP-binding cassette subfamily B protein
MRGRVMLVEQQPRIFSATVRDNLTLGLELSDDELAHALAAVELSDYVAGLPQGLETELHYQGANLSGGQRQRLSIARALLRKPALLILDEGTSALDAATASSVLRSVKSSLRDGVLVLITHDPAVAAMADEVIDLGASPQSARERLSRHDHVGRAE